MPIRHFFSFAMVLATLLCALPLLAHSDSQSSLQMDIAPGRITADWSLTFRDFATWVPAAGGDYASQVISRVRDERDRLLELRADDRPIPPAEMIVRSPAPGVVIVHFVYTLTSEPSDLQVRCLCLDRLPAGHHQVLTVEDRREGREGNLIDQQIICIEQDTAVVEVPPLPASTKEPRRLKLIAKIDAGDQAAASSVGPVPAAIPTNVAVFRSVMIFGFAALFAGGWLAIRAYGKGRIR